MACGACGARRNRVKKAMTTVATKPRFRNARKLVAEVAKGAAEIAGVKEKTAIQEDEKEQADGK